MNRVILWVFAVTLFTMFYGCNSPNGGGTATTSSTTVTCKPLIQYSGYQVDVEAVNIPIGGKTINLGKAFVGPQQIQQAQAATQALDVLQYNQCQTMLMLPEEQRMAYVSQREQTIQALSQALQALDSATSAIEYNNAVSTAQKQQATLSAKPSASGSAGAAPASGASAAGQNTAASK